ncbi:Enamine deaminase RidA, house cleaning of reactive enamine intermediates, YjgF/YER057c/UK114 family [Lentzea albidocapillata subsp. violacea]|uniref:Enamine deaminase RidA, house cleaning of reactive enamine intermediates, YjgF/YER057c/UK114 family n=1 Tax=Lentzea albidocapillata subsp. violacea TaxID=128104 RepID=A0A1G9PS37_9PSEU|nr:RidA family protein [Lentzea albidocapillata]SDM01281.1 Enamine deaminase RidA, house cleaning of reactive enamine intermediates, YjgF/YER057c/UK114 family [Lentzea albidocapillata subsp. violacea]
MPAEERLTELAALPATPGYAHAVAVTGRLAFVSGQVAVDAAGCVVGVDDLAAQTRQALSNLHHVIRSLGADWSDVVKFTWFVLDVSDIQTIRAVRDEILRPALGQVHNPASTLVQVAALFGPDFLVEVEAVVAIPGEASDV